MVTYLCQKLKFPHHILNIKLLGTRGPPEITASYTRGVREEITECYLDNGNVK